MMLTLPRLAVATLLALSALPAGACLQEAPAPAPAPDAAAAPARTAKLGEKAPDFTLKSVKDEDVTLSALTASGQIVVLEWFNPDCPISRAYHVPESTMGALAASYAGRNVTWLAINSGAPGKQGAGKERNLAAAREFDIGYPVLIDGSGAVGRQYGARTTPHMYVIDAQGVLRYAGAIDDGSPQSKGRTNHVKNAVDALLAGEEVAVKDSRPFGCSVKYAD